MELCNFHMAALMFLTGHGTKARTHACAEIAQFPTMCIIRTWEARGHRPDDAHHWEMCDFCMGIGSCYKLPLVKMVFNKSRFCSFGETKYPEDNDLSGVLIYVSGNPVTLNDIYVMQDDVHITDLRVGPLKGSSGCTIESKTVLVHNQGKDFLITTSPPS